MKPTLLEQLTKRESELFGDNQFPISTNISQRLMPVASLLLNRIPAFMPEYTLHDITHCEKILKNISAIMPEEVTLNIVELMILIYSVYLHDIGMVINTVEANKLKKTAEFRKLYIEFDKDVPDTEILTEFIRRNHVNRSLEYIDKFKSEYNVYKIDFDFKDVDISYWIKQVILSHAYPVEFIMQNRPNYPVDKLIGHYSVDIQYLSLLLRLGDILDFDIYRTPPFLYNHINPQNQISNDEWKKHQSVEGIIINEKSIRIDAFCKSAHIERLIKDFAKWIEIERQESIQLLSSTSNNNKLHLNNKVLLDCRNDGTYIFTEMQLKLDYEKVLSILMGTELYDSPDIFLREILQNSYDACKCRADQLKKDGEAYIPTIKINYLSATKELIVQDNGIGIDKNVFENYVISIGKSYYKSKSFQVQQYNFLPISNFGIGIISCFMVSDSIELKSLKYYSPTEHAIPVHYILNVNERYIDERQSDKKQFGTTITLKLKDDYAQKLNNKSIVEIIKENMTYQEIPITIIIDGITEVLNEDKINIKEDLKTINSILIWEINDDWLQGYFTIHGYQHQSIIEQNKVSQQCFTITNKHTGFPLNIPWLIFFKMHVDISPNHKLKLKANRNKIHEDQSFIALKNHVIEYVISEFKNPKNVSQIYNFLSEARGNVFSGNQIEHDFYYQL